MSCNPCDKSRGRARSQNNIGHKTQGVKKTIGRFFGRFRPFVGAFVTDVSSRYLLERMTDSLDENEVQGLHEPRQPVADLLLIGQPSAISVQALHKARPAKLSSRTPQSLSSLITTGTENIPRSLSELFTCWRRRGKCFVATRLIFPVCAFSFLSGHAEVR